MPNELKNALNASTQISETKKSPQLGSSTISMMLWTISGIALAACSGGTRVVTRDGDGSGGTVFVPQAAGGPVVRVVDGPIKGAAVYFDLDGDGVVSAAERAAQTDASGRPFYVTDENGQAQIPEAYEGVHFVADVNGAFDTSTGERLSGEFQSLSAGGIASPLTDLLNQVERDGGSAQGTLDEIFGMDAEGNSEVTIADVLNYENYGILSSSPSALTAPTPPVAPTAPPPGSADSSLYLADLAAYQAGLLQYEADLAAYQANLANILIEFITRASLAITEIDQDSTLVTSGGASDTTENRIAVLKALFDGDPSNDNAALSTLIANREAIGRQILDGKPVAAPDPHVNIEEDGVFNAADYDHGGDDERANIEALFGFIDPGQNAANEVISAFRGIYVKGTVDNADLTFGGTALTSSLTTTGDGVPSNTPSESGFYYVSFGHLSTMSISPDANYHGSLELEYYVFDGIDWSEKATLEINVRSVNDAPTFTGLSGDRNSDPSIAQYVLSTDGQVILADGTLEGLIQGLNDVEDANDDLTFTIGGPDGDLFRVVGDNASGFRLELIDPSTAKIAGATYQITITVTDTEGLDSATQSFTLTQGGFYLENTGLRTYSNGAALIDEEQDASATPIVLGTIGVEGLNTAEVGTAGTDGYKSTVTFTTDTPDFDILNGQLRFTGSDSGDFESDESLTVNVKASYYTVVEQVSDFTGQKDVQADGHNSGDQGDVDARTFSYNGGAVSFVTRGDFDENGDAFASVNIASGVIYVPHQGTDIPAKSITFEAVEGLQYGANGFIIVNGDGDANAPTSTPIKVTLTFTDVEEQPTSAGGTAAVDEENTYTFTAADFGFSGYKGGDTLAAILITSLPQASNGGLLYYDGNPLDPDGGTPPTLPYRVTLADIEAGKLTFQPQNTAASYDATFNFKVEDQLGEVSADDAVFTFSVTADDDAGVFSSSNTYTARISAADGGSTTFTDIAASDPEGRVLILQNGVEDSGNPGTFTAQGQYGRLEFVRSTSGTSQWRYFVDATLPATIAIAHGVERVDTFTFRIDTNTTQTVSITVVGQNEDPEFAQDTYREVVYSNIGDTDTILDVGVTDPDGDSLTYSITSGNDNNLFEIDASTGVISLVSGASLTTSSIDEHTLTISVSDGRGGTDTTTVTLDVIAPIVMPGNFVTGATQGDDTRNGTSANDQIQGWDGNDTINTNGGDDLVAGGLGDDTINLGSGADTVLYRYESDFNSTADWKATDGADVINDFKVGTDRLVMIDTSNDGDPINNLAEFSADGDRPVINVITGGTNGAFIVGLTFTFDVDGDSAGKVLTINFDTSDESSLVRWTNHVDLNWVSAGTVMADATQLDDYIFDGMIDFITPDGLPAGLTII